MFTINYAAQFCSRHHLYNTGEPCAPLSGIMNGYIDCTGPQVTDENCTFACDPGYYLTGSDLRTCQPDHTWSGEDAVCPPLKCEELTAPENASVSIPCNNEYTSNCTLVCDDGFHVEGNLSTTEWIQTCAFSNEGGVKWTQSKQCVGTFVKKKCAGLH